MFCKILLILCLVFTSKLAIGKESWIIVNKKGEIVEGYESSRVRPIASISKLMLAIVAVRELIGEEWNESVMITEEDVDRLKFTRSHLSVGTIWTRRQLFELALIASDNRAAHALARDLGRGDVEKTIKRMNQTAREFGWLTLHFEDPTGLTQLNVGSAEDVARMTHTALSYNVIQDAAQKSVWSENGVKVKNTNGWIRTGRIKFNVSKTGFTNEAGRCITLWAGDYGLTILGSKTIQTRDQKIGDFAKSIGLLPDFNKNEGIRKTRGIAKKHKKIKIRR